MMFKWIFRVLGIIVLLSVLLVLGTCAWQNCRSPSPKTVNLNPPSIEKAAYSVNISGTGQPFYSNEVDVITVAAEDVVIMHGYWEVTKGKYKFHDATLSLNEAIFGNIEVRKR